MITLILNIIIYLSLKSMVRECIWHDPNYYIYIYIYQLLYILIELLQYLQHIFLHMPILFNIARASCTQARNKQLLYN
jgi:hypothetical protein